MEIEKEDERIWVMKRGFIGKEEFVIRIAKNEISSYIFEDIESELNKWAQLKISSLSKVTYFSEGDIVHFV